MTRRAQRIGFVVVAGVILAAIIPAPAFAADDPTLLAESDTSVWYIGAPVTDGQYVLWHEGSTSVHSPCDVIMEARVETREPTTLAKYCNGSFALAGGRAVWTTSAGDSDDDHVPDVAAGVFLKELASSEEYTLATDVGFGAWGIATDYYSVAWIQSTGVNLGDPLRIISRPIGPYEPVLVRESGPGTTIANLKIYGGYFYWLERPAQEPLATATVYRWFPGGQPEPLFEAPHLRWFDVQDGGIAYLSGDQLAWIDPAYGPVAELATGVSGGASTDGRYVLWATAEFPERVTLRGIDLRSGARFTAVEYRDGDSQTLGWIDSSSIMGGAVAWSRFAYNQYQTAVHLVRLVDLLPSARRNDPGTTDPAWTYYSETGHYLTGDFRLYWNQSGGLPVFGYPMTEEFSENERTVQYLERQRFEWRPENSGTPYYVLLGLLGSEDALRRGFTDTPPFQGVSESAPPGSDCQYFAETRHFACGLLVDYWHSHGLEFGDPGVSYRESLALFGFPISEAFTHPESGLTVQYFERAIFETHPENAGTPYEVLLRRLGADALVERGWS